MNNIFVFYLFFLFVSLFNCIAILVPIVFRTIKMLRLAEFQIKHVCIIFLDILHKI